MIVSGKIRIAPLPSDLGNPGETSRVGLSPELVKPHRVSLEAMQKIREKLTEEKRCVEQYQGLSDKELSKLEEIKTAKNLLDSYSGKEGTYKKMKVHPYLREAFFLDYLKKNEERFSSISDRGSSYSVLGSPWEELMMDSPGSPGSPRTDGAGSVITRFHEQEVEDSIVQTHRVPLTAMQKIREKLDGEQRYAEAYQRKYGRIRDLEQIINAKALLNRHWGEATYTFMRQNPYLLREFFLDYFAISGEFSIEGLAGKEVTLAYAHAIRDGGFSSLDLAERDIDDDCLASLVDRKVFQRIKSLNLSNNTQITLEGLEAIMYDALELTEIDITDTDVDIGELMGFLVADTEVFPLLNTIVYRDAKKGCVSTINVT